MAWPDLTLVPEGALTRVVWAADESPVTGLTRFASAGSAVVQAEAAQDALAGIVDRVLLRLTEMGLPKTRLADEWTAVGQADRHEQEFCRAVAKLGLDPYAIDSESAENVVRIADLLPPDLTSDFFDTADPHNLSAAATWVQDAVATAGRLTTLAQALTSLRQRVAAEMANSRGRALRAWETGYLMARAVRQELGLDLTQQLDVSPWVGAEGASRSSGGVQGVAVIRKDRCGLVLDDRGMATPSRSFMQARALGRSLARPQQSSFLLSAARGDDERVARAFAAELLAPAEGIRRLLQEIGTPDDTAFDAVATGYGVSPLVIQHQYDNQLARPVRRGDM